MNTKYTREVSRQQLADKSIEELKLYAQIYCAPYEYPDETNMSPDQQYVFFALGVALAYIAELKTLPNDTEYYHDF